MVSPQKIDQAILISSLHNKRVITKLRVPIVKPKRDIPLPTTMTSKLITDIHHLPPFERATLTTHPKDRRGRNPVFSQPKFSQIVSEETTSQHFLRMKAFQMSRKLRKPKPPPPGDKERTICTNDASSHVPNFPKRSSPKLPQF